MAFGLSPRPTMLAVPLIAFVAGFGWAGFGTCVAATMNSIDNFSYVMSGIITPMFLVAGTFFPLTKLPSWAQWAADLNPLHHTVELVRHAAFGFQGWADAGHFAFLVVFALAMWRIAIWRMTLRLVD